MSDDIDVPHNYFTRAVALLGGSRATARALDISERSVLRLMRGEHRVHDGFLIDLALALSDHAAGCIELGQQINAVLASGENR